MGTTADIQVHSRKLGFEKSFQYNFAQKLTKGKTFVYLIDLWPTTKGQVCDLWALEALEMFVRDEVWITDEKRILKNSWNDFKQRRHF